MRELTLVRSRPWAEVWRVETDGGRWWLKVNGAQTTYEPRLLGYLAGCGSDLLADAEIHPDQPWSLIGDAGRPLPEAMAGWSREEQVDFWCVLLAEYAELQRTVAARGLPDLGLPDFSPAQLVHRFDEVLSEPVWFRAPAAPEATPAQLDRVRRSRPALARAARVLAGGLPPSIQHDDLHQANVLVAPPSAAARRGRPRIIDWGDAVWAHPFGTLLVTRRSLAAGWSTGAGDPALSRVTDAYLEPWSTAGESRAELLDQVDLAVRTGCLTRAAGWVRALQHPGAGLALGFGDGPSFWMTALAEALGTPETPR